MSSSQERFRSGLSGLLIVCLLDCAPYFQGQIRTMQPMLNIAVRAAHHAGDFIVRKLNKLPDLQVEVKAKNDFVSEVDRQAEAHITRYP